MISGLYRVQDIYRLPQFPAEICLPLWGAPCRPLANLKSIRALVPVRPHGEARSTTSHDDDLAFVRCLH